MRRPAFATARPVMIDARTHFVVPGAAGGDIMFGKAGRSDELLGKAGLAGTGAAEDQDRSGAGIAHRDRAKVSGRWQQPCDAPAARSGKYLRAKTTSVMALETTRLLGRNAHVGWQVSWLTASRAPHRLAPNGRGSDVRTRAARLTFPALSSATANLCASSPTHGCCGRHHERRTIRRRRGVQPG
ncbi:hypothetical protein D9M70_525560 [compost metagenome]